MCDDNGGCGCKKERDEVIAGLREMLEQAGAQVAEVMRERDELRQQLEQASRSGVQDGWVRSGVMYHCDGGLFVELLDGDAVACQVYGNDHEELMARCAMLAAAPVPPAQPSAAAQPEHTKKVIANAEALLNLDANGALVPNGIGGLARNVICSLLECVRQDTAGSAQPSDSVPAQRDETVIYGSGFSAGYDKGRSDGFGAAMQRVDELRGDALLVPRDALLDLLVVAEEHSCHGDGECQICAAVDAASDLLAGGDA